jgi:hypothetical protein
MDTRWDRDPDPDPKVDYEWKMMLVQEQLDWLLNGLSDSKAFFWKIMRNSKPTLTHVLAMLIIRGPFEPKQTRFYNTSPTVQSKHCYGYWNFHTDGTIDDGSYGWFGLPILIVANTGIFQMVVALEVSSVCGVWREGATSECPVDHHFFVPRISS